MASPQQQQILRENVTLSAETAAAPQPPQMMGNHPVPPAAIPASEHRDGEQSMLSTWVSNIPFVGRVIVPGGN